VVWTAGVTRSLRRPSASERCAPSREYVGPIVVEAQPRPRSGREAGSGAAAAASQPAEHRPVAWTTSSARAPGPRRHHRRPGHRRRSAGRDRDSATPRRAPRRSRAHEARRPVDGRRLRQRLTAGPRPAGGADDGRTQPLRSAAPTPTGPIKGLVDENPGQARPGADRRLWGKLLTRFRILSSVYYDVDRTAASTPPAAAPRPQREPASSSTSRTRPTSTCRSSADIGAGALWASQPGPASSTTSRTMQMMKRFHVESDAAYVAMNEIVPGLDVKLGRQIVVWGTATSSTRPTTSTRTTSRIGRSSPSRSPTRWSSSTTTPLSATACTSRAVYVPLFYPGPAAPVRAARPARIPFAEVAVRLQDRARPRSSILQDRLACRPTSKYIPTCHGHVLHAGERVSQRPSRRSSSARTSARSTCRRLVLLRPPRHPDARRGERHDRCSRLNAERGGRTATTAIRRRHRCIRGCK
jgi:hypothetical protein